MHALIEEQIYKTNEVQDYGDVKVRLALPQDEEQLLATLTCAFINDPPARWLYPASAHYLSYFPAFARAFGGGALELGTAWSMRDHVGCALWFPPGSGPEEQALIAVIENSIPAPRHAEVFAVLEALGQAHPAESHWYLPLIGVDAASQGGGIAATLLRKTLAVCDRAGLPAYLEASSPRSIPLYERFGFRRGESLRVGTCPAITPMWREPGRVPEHGPATA